MAQRGCLGCCDDLCFEKRGLHAAVVVAGVELTRWRSSGLRRELTYLMRERASTVDHDDGWYYDCKDPR